LWNVTKDIGTWKDLKEEKHERIVVIEHLGIQKKKENRGLRRIVTLPP